VNFLVFGSEFMNNAMGEQYKACKYNPLTVKTNYNFRCYFVVSGFACGTDNGMLCELIPV